MALALYRKYRPKSLSDVFGQEHVIEVLINSAVTDRIAHAYLFYGPRGTGKTTIARLLAKVRVCETRQSDKKFQKTGEPCNNCGPCLDIDSGKGVDVLEIDAASNRGIDEIRSLKEGLRLSPSSYSHKVIIIDETHMLTKEAFNALLKTLEEPPSHAVIILATTEFEKVPATITSRTQRFHFKKISVTQIVEKLKNIVQAEKLTVDEDALELLASLSDGSLRDAESLLDQITSLKDNVTVDIVEKHLGKIGFNKASVLANNIIQKDLDGALEFINQINETGYNVVDLTKEVIQYLKIVLTAKHSQKVLKLLEKEFIKRDLEKIISHSKQIDTQTTTTLIRDLIKAYSDMRYSPFISTPLEVTLIQHLS